MTLDLLQRVVVPHRLALSYRDGETLGYNPGLNIWARLNDVSAEVLRWLRAGRDRDTLDNYLARRFGFEPEAATAKREESVKWCILRHLLYLDGEPAPPHLIRSDKPLQTVYWICTQACNLRCTYCYQEAMFRRPNELSTAEAKDLVDQVVEAGAQTFVITGGEPFSRRDLLDIAEYSKTKGLRTNVITNGHYIRKRNLTRIARVFDLVTISLDHMVPEHHDRQRGERSWERAMSGIDLLLDAGVKVDVNSVLSRYGLRDLGELLQLRHKKRIGVHKIMPQFPMGRGNTSRDDALTPDELIQLNDQIVELKHGDGLAQSSLRPEGSQSKKGSYRNHCGAGLSEVSVDPEGWVYPCKLLQYPQFRTENIRGRRLANIYSENELLRISRDTTVEMLTPCKDCIIKHHCGGGCRGIHFAFTKEYTKADPLFCSFLRRSFEAQAWSSTGELPGRRQTHFQAN
jgi:radical SAM protein with 4Fe4S-binding SPASM domain